MWLIPTNTKIRRWPVLILALGSLIATSFGSRSVEALWWPEAACNRSCTPKLCMNPKRLNNCVANCGDHSKIIDCFTKNRSALSEENKEKVLKNLYDKLNTLVKKKGLSSHDSKVREITQAINAILGHESPSESMNVQTTPKKTIPSYPLRPGDPPPPNDVPPPPTNSSVSPSSAMEPKESAQKIGQAEAENPIPPVMNTEHTGGKAPPPPPPPSQSNSKKPQSPASPREGQSINDQIKGGGVQLKKTNPSPQSPKGPKAASSDIGSTIQEAMGGLRKDISGEGLSKSDEEKLTEMLSKEKPEEILNRMEEEWDMFNDNPKVEAYLKKLSSQ